MGAVVSSPAVGRNGHIFIGSNDGHLYSFFTNGTLRWAAALEGYVTASPAVSPLDFGVVVGDRAGMLYKFNDASGALQWGVQACSRGPAPDPLATAAGAAFATSPTGFGAGIASSAAIDALGTVYIGCLDGRVRALSSGGGSVLWSVGTGGGIVSSPGLRSEGAGAAWGGGTLYLYVASLDGCLHALLARDGSARWGCYSAGAPLTSSPALPSGELAGGEDGAVGDTVYLTTTNGRALAVWGGNGTLRWEFGGFGRALAAAAGGQLAPLTPTPAFARNCSALYVGGWDGGVWALSPTTGAPLWNFSTPAVLSASPALGYSEGTCGVDYRRAGFAARGGGAAGGAAGAAAAGGLPPAPLWPTCTCFLYTAGEDGWVRAFNGSSGEQVWVFKGALGPIRSSPAIDATGSVVFGAANVLGNMGAVYKLEEGRPSVSASASGSPTASPSYVPLSASATGSARASRSASASPSDSFSPAPSLNTSATPSEPAPTRSPSPCPSPRASPPATPSPPGAATRAPSRLPTRSPSPSPTLLTPLPTPSATVSRWVSPSTHPWPCAGGNAARTNAAPASGAGSAIAALAPQRMFNPGSDAPGVLWTLHLGGPLRSPPTLHSLGWVLVGVDAPGCGGGGGLAVVDGVRGVLLWCVPSLGSGGSGVRGGAALSAVNASFPALGEDRAYIGLNGGLSAVLLTEAPAGGGGGGGGGAGGSSGGIAWAYSSPELCGWDAGSNARAAPLGPSSASPAYTYASPVLIGGATVVATCSDAASGSLAVGLDARSGRLQWSHSLPPGSALTTTPAFSAALNLTYLSYVLGGGEGGASGASAAASLLRVRAVHAGNGSTAWDVAVSGGGGSGGGGTAPPAAPLLVAPNNLLLLPVAFTTLAALDARSGAGVWAWSAPPGDLLAAPGSLPIDARLAPWPALCPASGAAYFPAGAVLYKLAGSGSASGGGAWASPAAPPPLLWSFATGAALVAPPTLAFDGATVVQPSSDGFLYALRAGSGALAWRLPGAGWTPAAPGANGVLYLGSLGGQLQAVGALSTRSPSASPSLSATPSASATYSRASLSATPSASASASPSLSPASTATLSPPLSVSGSGSHSGSPAPSRQPSRSVSASASPRQSQSEAVVSSAPVSPSNNCPTNTRNFRVNLGLSGAGGGAWGGARGAWLCACALGAASLALLLGS